MNAFTNRFALTILASQRQYFHLGLSELDYFFSDAENENQRKCFITWLVFRSTI